MSRIGRLPIAVPAGVTVEIAENNVVTVKGPKGTYKGASCRDGNQERRRYNRCYKTK